MNCVLTPGILWCIFFNRLFGPISPSTQEFKDIPYPIATDVPELEQLIDQKIDILTKKFFSLTHMTEPTSGKLQVVFYYQTPKTKRKSSWFSHKDTQAPENIAWERWLINVECLLSSQPDHKPSPGSPTDLSRHSFEQNMLQIMDYVGNQKDHIPPITTLDVSPFPYEIVVGSSEHSQAHSHDDETWGNYIKKMLD